MYRYLPFNTLEEVLYVEVGVQDLVAAETGDVAVVERHLEELRTLRNVQLMVTQHETNWNGKRAMCIR